jgi:hypothetical protein
MILKIGVGSEAGEWFLSGWIFDTFGSDQREAVNAPRGEVFAFGFPSKEGFGFGFGLYPWCPAISEEPWRKW